MSRAVLAAVGARVVDSLPFSRTGTPDAARALRSNGVEVVAGYLGVITPAVLAAVWGAGLSFMPVTLAGATDASATLAACAALGLPLGTTVWFDLEGKAAFAEGETSIPKLVAWANAVSAAGFQPGLYVGVPQPLTSDELYALPFVRYWRGQGSIRDRHDALAEPRCGWCMVQAYPQHLRSGVLVDDDMVQADYLGRLPMVAAP